MCESGELQVLLPPLLYLCSQSIQTYLGQVSIHSLASYIVYYVKHEVGVFVAEVLT